MRKVDLVEAEGRFIQGLCKECSGIRSRALGAEGRGHEKIGVNGEENAEVNVWCDNHKTGFVVKRFEKELELSVLRDG